MSSQNKIFQREINKDRFDYVLFLVLTCVLALVTLKGFTFAPEIRNDWNSLGFSYDTSIPLILAVPFDLLYVGVAVWFLIRRKVAFGKKQLIMTTIFIILAAFRISSYFLFPESVEFSLSNPFDPNQIIDISYSDYALVDKCIECIAEVIFLFHLYLIAMVFPTLNKDKKDIVSSVVLMLFAAVAIVMTIYSMITEGDILLGNLYYYLGKPGYMINDAISFTSHRNVFGFFLTLGVISQVLFLFKKPNFISILIMLYLAAFTILIHSRTSISICFLLLGLTMISFIVLNLKKHPVISCSFILMILAAIILVVLSLTVFKDRVVVKKIYEELKKFFDFTSVNNRIDHISTSWKLLTYHSYFFWMGLGRVPFMHNYHQYLVAINYEPNTVTSHNGFLEPFFYQGAVMGIIYFIFYIVIFGLIIYLFVKKDKNIGISYLLAGLGLFIHSIFEMRAIFIFESTSILFMMIFLFPLIKEYSYFIANKEDIIDNRRYKTLIYKLS